MFRGPQGTLFGRNTPAGVIKFNSARPSRDAGGYFQVSYGDDGSANFEGAVGGALGEHWSARFSGLYQHRDDWVDNVRPPATRAMPFEGFDEIAGRVAVPRTSRTTASARSSTCMRAASTARRACSAPISSSPGTNDLVSGFDPDIDVHATATTNQDLDSVGGSVRLSWDFDRVTLHSITGYESVGRLQPRRHRRRLRRTPVRDQPTAALGFIPFPAESAGRAADHEPAHAGVPLGVAANGAHSTGRPASTTSTKTSRSTASTTTRWRAASRTATPVSTRRTRPGPCSARSSTTCPTRSRCAPACATRTTRRTSRPSASSRRFGGGAIGPISVSPSDEDVTGDVSGTWALNDDTNCLRARCQGLTARRASRARVAVRRRRLGRGFRDHHVLRGGHQDQPVRRPRPPQLHGLQVHDGRPAADGRRRFGATSTR